MTGTYNGTTAGSTSQNPPILLAEVLGGRVTNAPNMTGGRLWFYQSTNYSTDIENGGTPIITDGKTLGMRVGDVLLSVASTASDSVIPVLALDVIVSVTTAGAYTSTNRITSTCA